MTTQSQAPTPWYVPFATGDSSRVEIPVTSSDPTRASQTLGFPPLTMQPPESGGVPPQGEDFNGAMNQIARVAWWMLNGGLFPYNSTFATNSNINGYPNGAVLLRSDLAGIWLNLADNNQVAPDAATGLVASNNWAPLVSYGRSSVSGLTGGTNTLSYAQAGFDRILLSGTLASNQTIVLPNWVKRWLIANNTTGAFSLTVQPPTGAGVVIPQNAAETPVVCDGTNMSLPLFNVVSATTATQPPQMSQIQTQAGTAFAAAGTAPNYTVTTSPAMGALAANQRIRVAFAANGTLGSNTLNRDGQGAKALMQFDGAGNLVPANIVAGLLTDVEYNGTYMIVLDPLTPSFGVVGSMRGAVMNVAAASASGNWSAEEVTLKTAVGGAAYTVANPSGTINLATTGAGGMDTGTAPVSGWVAIYGIYNPTTNVFNLLATNTTSAAVTDVYTGGHMPAGYTASVLVSVVPTNASSQFPIFYQQDRQVDYFINAYTGAAQGSFTSLSLSSCVPKNAKRWIANWATISTGASGIAIAFCPTSGGQGNPGYTTAAISASASGQTVGSNFPPIPLITAQTIYASSSGSTNNFVYNSYGYTF